MAARSSASSFGSSAMRISCSQRRDALLQGAQLGLGQLAHLRVGQQRLGLGLGAFGGAQVADARDHRLDVRTAPCEALT